MNFKKELLDYFNKTEIPSALAPDKVSTFVRPRAAAKKAVETAEGEKTDSDSHTAAEKPQQISDPAAEKLRPRSSAEGEGGSPRSGADATAFIKIVFYHKLSRSEFLKLLGNTEIGSAAFEEIKENPSLTVRGLIDILEKTPLTSDDYKRLIIAAERSAQLREEARERLKAEGPRNGAAQSPAPQVKPKLNLNELTSPKTQEMPPIKVHREDRTPTNEFSLPAASGPEEKSRPASDGEAAVLVGGKGDEEQKQAAEKKEKPKKRLLFGKSRESGFDDEEESEDGLWDDRLSSVGEDEDGDYDDDYDDYEEKPRSNKGKFVAAAIGAVILIGASFGIRYYYTGSVMPKTDEPVLPEEELSEERIFGMMSDEPAAQLSDGVFDSEYTVGGIKEENPLKQIISTDKRLIYISGGSLYIFEQIGGQTDLLDVRNYPSDIRLLGLAETDRGIAVFSQGNGEPYEFTKKAESGEEGTAETGDESSQPEKISDSVIRPETVIELLDKDNPEKRTNILKYALSGSLLRLFNEKSRLIVLTEENMPSNSIKEDYATFMPYVLTSEGKKLCTAENTLVCNNCRSSAFTAVFSLDLAVNNENESENKIEAEVACTAGNLVRASAWDKGFLYLAAGDRLIKLSPAEGLAEKGSFEINGLFEEFSGISVFTDGAAGEQRIRATFKEENGAALAVLDGQLGLVNEVKGLGNGEAAAATCFYGESTYIVTESGVCYGIDGNNQTVTESGVKISRSDIYPISRDGDNPIGIKLTPIDEGGKRTGIAVGTVRLDGTETELSSVVISSKTYAKNALDEYLSSPAEKDISVIGVRELTDTANGIAVIPVVYFDGVSEVEQFVIFTVTSDGSISANGSMAQYDSYSKNIFALVKGDYAIAVTDSRIITAKAENGNVTGYYDITPNNEEYSR